MSQIAEYLLRIVERRATMSYPPDFKYSCVEDFVLREGMFYGGRSDNSNEYKKGKMKDCYRNAYLLADAFSDLTYCEGYAMGIIPVLHAWCIDSEGQVIDNTWPDGSEYYGVRFKFWFVTDTIFRHRCWGVIDNWQDKWPLLRGEGDKKWKASGMTM